MQILFKQWKTTLYHLIMISITTKYSSLKSHNRHFPQVCRLSSLLSTQETSSSCLLTRPLGFCLKIKKILSLTNRWSPHICKSAVFSSVLVFRKLWNKELKTRVGNVFERQSPESTSLRRENILCVTRVSPRSLGFWPRCWRYSRRPWMWLVSCTAYVW